MAIFNKKIWSQKFLASWLIAIFLLTALLSNVWLPTKEAQAAKATLPMQIVQWITDKIAWAKDYYNQYQQLKEQINIKNLEQWSKDFTLEQLDLKEAWNETRADLLQELSNDVMDWIQGENGDTAFVDSFPDYFEGLVEEAAEEFIEEALGIGNMCDVFDDDVKNYVSGQREKFQSQVRCPLGNQQSFLNDFEQGGWDAWFKFLEPAGNVFGAFMMADDAKQILEAFTYTGEFGKLVANEGFKGDESTPGIVQSNALQRVSMMDLDYLLSADEQKEYLSSVVDSFINRIIKEGVSTMPTDEYVPQGQPPSYVPPAQYTPAQVSAAINQKATAQSLGQKLQLLKENLQALSDALNNNLDLKSRIMADQEQILDVITQLQSQNCSLPSWASEYGPIPSIKQNFNNLNNQVSKIGEKIGQAEAAIAGVASLNQAIDQVIVAQASGDQAAIDGAMVIYYDTLNTTVASLQQLLASQSTNLATLSNEIDQYNTQIVNQTNQATTTDYNTYYNQLITEKNRLTEAQNMFYNCTGFYIYGEGGVSGGGGSTWYLKRDGASCDPTKTYECHSGYCALDPYSACPLFGTCPPCKCTCQPPPSY